jgi:hypothetical protein
MAIPAAVQPASLPALAEPAGVATGPTAPGLSVVIVGWRVLAGCRWGAPDPVEGALQLAEAPRRQRDVADDGGGHAARWLARTLQEFLDARRAFVTEEPPQPPDDFALRRVGARGYSRSHGRRLGRSPSARCRPASGGASRTRRSDSSAADLPGKNVLLALRCHTRTRDVVRRPRRYSARSATEGSIRAARLAGMTQAPIPTTAKSAATDASAAGSFGPTS